MKIHRVTALLLLLTAILGGCSRPAKDYANEVQRRHEALLSALQQFRSYQSTATGRAVVVAHKDLLKFVGQMNLHTLSDIQRLSPEAFRAYAVESDTNIEPIRKKLLDELAMIKSTVTSDKNAPMWDLDGRAPVGLPVFQISGGTFYFMDWDSGYDIDKFVRNFSMKAQLEGWYNRK